jgi:hypothetical protein
MSPWNSPAQMQQLREPANDNAVHWRATSPVVPETRCSSSTGPPEPASVSRRTRNVSAAEVATSEREARGRPPPRRGHRAGDGSVETRVDGHPLDATDRSASKPLQVLRVVLAEPEALLETDVAGDAEAVSTVRSALAIGGVPGPAVNCGCNPLQCSGKAADRAVYPGCRSECGPNQVGLCACLARGTRMPD